MWQKMGLRGLAGLFATPFQGVAVDPGRGHPALTGSSSGRGWGTCLSQGGMCHEWDGARMAGRPVCTET